jgi:hypothetical protein
MNNLDNVIKEILNKMYYQVGETIDEQQEKLVKPKVKSSLDVMSNLNKPLDPFGTKPSFLDQFKPKTPTPTFEVVNEINQFDTCVRGMSFRVPGRGAVFGIRPISWLNRYEPYNAQKAQDWFGSACKFWSKIPAPKEEISSNQQYFFDSQSLLPCEAQVNWERSEIYDKVFNFNTKYVNKTPEQKIKIFYEALKNGTPKWREILKKSNNQIFLSPDGGYQDKKTGKVVRPTEYTYNKNCIRINEEQCKRLSWQTLHLNASVGMKSFTTIDRRKDKENPTTTNWCACTGRALSEAQQLDYFERGVDVSAADMLATETVVYPWDVKYIGFKLCNMPNSECIIEPQKIVPVDIQFTIGTGNLGSMDYQQMLQLQKQYEIPTDENGNPTISKEEIEKRQANMALFQNGAIIKGI